MNIKEINIDIININGELKISINPKENIISINGYNKTTNEDTIYDLLRIIRTWKKIYKREIIDSEEYKIEIINQNNEIDTYEGIGDYPENYSSFKEWIGGIIND